MKKLLLLLIGASTVFVSCQKDEIEALNGNIDTLEASLNARNQAIIALENQLENALEAHATDVEMYEGIIADAEAQIADLDANVASQATMIAELEVVISDANAAIALLEEENAELEATIAELQSRLNTALTELRNRPTITVTQFVDRVVEVVRNVEVPVAGTFTQADLDAARASAAGGSTDGFSTIAEAIAAVAVGGDLDALNALLNDLRGNEDALDTLIDEVLAAIAAIPTFDATTASWIPAFAGNIADFTQTLTDANGLTGGTRNIVVTLSSSEYSFGGGTGADAFNRRSGLDLDAAVAGANGILSAENSTIYVYVKHTYSYTEGGADFTAQPAVAQTLTFVPPTNTVTDTTEVPAGGGSDTTTSTTEVPNNGGNSGQATDTTSGGQSGQATDTTSEQPVVDITYGYSIAGGNFVETSDDSEADLRAAAIAAAGTRRVNIQLYSRTGTTGANLPLGSEFFNPNAEDVTEYGFTVNGGTNPGSANTDRAIVAATAAGVFGTADGQIQIWVRTNGGTWVVDGPSYQNPNYEAPMASGTVTFNFDSLLLNQGIVITSVEAPTGATASFSGYVVTFEGAGEYTVNYSHLGSDRSRTFTITGDTPNASYDYVVASGQTNENFGG